MSARDTILVALTRYYRSNADPRGTAVQVLDGYDADRRGYLLKERSDVRDRLCSDAYAAGRAEALADDGQAYDGQLAMLTGLVATLNAVATHGDLGDVRKLLAEYARDDAEARKHSGSTDFFQRGHTYTRPEHHLKGPDGQSFTWTFLVSSTNTSPTGERYAHGFRTHNTTTRWEPHSVSELAWTQDGWTDVTDGGDR